MRNDPPTKPGDQVVRRPRQSEIAPVLVHTRRRRPKTVLGKPGTVLLTALTATMVIGALLLMLPFANTEPGIAPPVVAFFTSVSAVSTTGLTLETTATYWTPFGQWIIAMLIFVGGLGFMTGVTFLLTLTGRRVSLEQNLLMREERAGQPLEGLVRLAVQVLILDVAITGLGIVPLWVQFSHYYPVGTALWHAVFHSISAFNTAGFDIVGPLSLIPMSHDYLLLTELTLISVVGAISYPVLLQLIARKSRRVYTLDTKLVLATSLVLWLGGSSLVGLFAGVNQSLTDEPGLFFGVFSVFYNTISGSTTTGFATIDFSQVGEAVLLVMIPLMFVGGATGSTAGGIKVQTVAVLVIATVSFLRGHDRVRVFRRQMPASQVNRALVTTMVAALIALTAVLFINLLQPEISAIRLLFDVLSALGTVGLSDGALSELHLPGVALFVFLMWLGRAGVLSLIVVLAPSERPDVYHFPEEPVKLG